MAEIQRVANIATSSLPEASDQLSVDSSIFSEVLHIFVCYVRYSFLLP
jgi:hypothetical protein